MYGKTHKIRRTVSAFALVASVAVVAVPAALAGSTQPGMIPSKLGSPDPRDSAQKVLYSPSIVASSLGSQDPRETASVSTASPSIVASRLGSPDVRDATPRGIEVSTDGSNGSIVARQLGSPDVRDAIVRNGGLYGDFMFNDYLGGAHWVVVPHLSGAQFNQQGPGLNELLLAKNGPATPVGQVEEVSTDAGINWGKVGIGVAVAACGLLLLVALGIGARQVRHGGHRLGSV